MVRNAASAASLFFGKATVAFVASIIFTRSLGPAGRGHIVFVLNTAGMVTLLAGAGTGSALLRLKKAGGQSASDLSTAAVGATVVYGLLATTVFGGAWAALRSTAFAGISPGVAFLVAALIGPLLLHQNLTQAAGLDDRLARTAWASLLGSSIYLVAVAVVAATGWLTEEAVIGAFAIGAAVSPLLLIWPFRVVHLRRSGAWRNTTALLRASLTANVAAMSVLLLWRIDVLLVKVLRGDADLGRYSAATSIAEVLLVLVVSLRTALLPQHGGGRTQAETGAVIAGIVRMALAVALPTAVAMAIASGPILVAVYGADFRGASMAMAVMLPGVVFLGLQYPLFDALAAAGEGRRLTMISVGALLSQVMLDIALIPGGGYVAAAVISSTTYLLLFTACALLFARRLGLRLRDVLVIRRSDIRRARRVIDRPLRRVRPSGC